jgi:uncharacterized DUF497 family protein
MTGFYLNSPKFFVQAERVSWGTGLKLALRMMRWSGKQSLPICISNVYTNLVDVLYRYRGQTFVWDGEKAAHNRLKHDVHFEVACEAFFDRFATFVDASTPDEERLALTGLTESFAVLFVVHLVREDDAIRIISARAATARERKTYENGG